MNCFFGFSGMKDNTAWVISGGAHSGHHQPFGHNLFSVIKNGKRTKCPLSNDAGFFNDDYDENDDVFA